MTPFAPVRIQRLPLGALALATCALLLQACGGGGSSSTPVPASTLPSVSAATADRLSYGRASIFTVTGANLSTAVSYTATGCDNVTLLAGGSATQQRFSCTPNKALSVRVAASASSAEIYTSTAPVPKPQVTLSTTAGSIVIELEPSVVQLTVDNFLAYVNAGFYNTTIFHRIAPLGAGSNYIVQGGGFTGVAGNSLTAQSVLRAAIALESNKSLSNRRGSIAMARTSVADSATAQFYLNVADNTFLDYASAASPGYAVFGHIVTGLAVIDTMSAVATRTVGGYSNVPVTDIVLQTAAQTL